MIDSIPAPDGTQQEATLWEKILEQLKTEVKPDYYRIFIKGAEQFELVKSSNGEPHQLTLATDNQFKRSWLQDRMSARIRQLASGFMAHKVDVRIVVADEMY